MALEEPEAGERGGDERLCLGLSFFLAPPAPLPAAEVPEPRPKGGCQALDVKGGVGVDQEDGLAAGQGVGRGLGSFYEGERERQREEVEFFSFPSSSSVSSRKINAIATSSELSYPLTWTSSAVLPLSEGPTNSTACPGRKAGANQSPVRTGRGAERRK